MKKYIILLCVLLFIMIAGCGIDKNTDTAKEPTPVVPLGTDWQKEGFKLETSSNAKFMNILMTPSLMMHEAGWQELVLSNPSFDFEYRDTISAYDKDILYLWHNYYMEDSMRYSLQMYPVNEPADSDIEVVLPVEISGGRARGMDVLNGRVFVLYESPSTEIWILQSGDGGKTWNHLKPEQADGISNAEYHPYDIYADDKGYLYVFSGTPQTEDILTIYDNGGKLIFTQILNEDLEAFECSAFHTPDGSVVILVSSKYSESPFLKWYNLPGEIPTELAKLETTDRYFMTMAEDGSVYVLSTSRLVKWDVKTGEQTPLFNFLRTDIETSDIRQIAINSEGDILLFSEGAQNWEIYTLSFKEAEQTDTELVLANLAGSNIEDIPLYIPQYNRKNPNAVSLEEGDGDPDAYRTRIMAELAAGKGPDLLWVHAEDLEILKEKGLLADLRQLIPEETLNEIFPGVLASGTRDDTLYGIYFGGSARSLFVANQTWQEDTWSFSDMIKLMEESDKLRKIINSNSPYQFKILTLYDLENSPFLDLEKGISYFDSEEFVKILKLFNNGGGLEEFGMETEIMTQELVQRGEFLTGIIPTYSLPAYSEFVQKYEDCVHIVNFPGENTYLGYWVNEYFLVVNNRCDNMEQIKRFLEYMLSPGIQRSMGRPVREDVIRSGVCIELSGVTYRGIYRYAGSVVEDLVLKEDNTSYIEEYISLLKQMGPLPRPYTKLKEIIYSGAQEYFEGKCTAERAAELIDNRVQLYLDEQK